MNPNAAAFAAILKQRQESGTLGNAPMDVNAMVHSAVSQGDQRKKISGNHGGNGHGVHISSVSSTYQPPYPAQSQYSTQQYPQYSPPQPYYQPHHGMPPVPYPPVYVQPMVPMQHQPYSSHNPVQPALGPNGQPLYHQPPHPPPSTLAYSAPNLYPYSSAPYASVPPGAIYAGYPPHQPPPPSSRPPIPTVPYQPSVQSHHVASSGSSSSSASYVFNQYKNSKTFIPGSGGNQSRRTNNNNGFSNNKSGGLNNNKFNKKAPADPSLEVYCDPCERVFASQAQYDKHLALHVPCSHPGCAFAASARAVERHTQIRHELFGSQGFKTIEVEGRSFTVLVGVRPEEVSRWREDRRKKFPSEENVILRQAGQRALKEAGGVNEAQKGGREKGGDKRKRGQDEGQPAVKGGKKARQEKNQTTTVEGGNQEPGEGGGGVSKKDNKKKNNNKNSNNSNSNSGEQSSSSSSSAKGGLILPPPLTGGARGTLLKKLLEDQVVEEENILLQGIRHLVRHHPLFLAGEGRVATSTAIGVAVEDDLTVDGREVKDEQKEGNEVAEDREEFGSEENYNDNEDDDDISGESDNEGEFPQEDEEEDCEEAAAAVEAVEGDGYSYSSTGGPGVRDCVSRSTNLSLTGCSVDDYSACSVNTERAVTGSITGGMYGLDDLNSLCSRD